MDAMERLYEQFPADDEVKTFYALSILSASSAVDDRTARMNVKAGALAMDVFKKQPEPSGRGRTTSFTRSTTRFTRRWRSRPRRSTPTIVPAVSHAVHMPTHIFIQHGMWNEVANQNIRAFNVAKELWQPGDVPGDMSHSGDWGQYGFLQLGDYAGARERIQAFEWMADTTKNPRAISALALVRARYIIETEEWKVQPVAESASNETILANGFSAVKTGDMATAERMEAHARRQGQGGARRGRQQQPPRRSRRGPQAGGACARRSRCRQGRPRHAQGTCGLDRAVERADRRRHRAA